MADNEEIAELRELLREARESAIALYHAMETFERVYTSNEPKIRRRNEAITFIIYMALDLKDLLVGELDFKESDRKAGRAEASEDDAEP